MKNPLLAPLLLIAGSTAANAFVIMLDFGPTTVAGDALTNSPYHSAAGGSFTDTAWNKVELADVSSGLVNSDGTAAAGIGLNLGLGIDSTIIDLATQPGSTNALGTAVNTGVYATSSVGRDGIFSGTGTQIRNLGVQITGLAAGPYEIFTTTRNTNTGDTYTMTTYASAGAVGANFDFVAGTYPSSALSFTGTGSTAAWVEEGQTGENFARLIVNLEEGEALNIAIQGDATQTRGFLNSLQVVQIPEPGSALLLAAALPLLFRRRRA